MSGTVLKVGADVRGEKWSLSSKKTKKTKKQQQTYSPGDRHLKDQKYLSEKNSEGKRE